MTTPPQGQTLKVRSPRDSPASGDFSQPSILASAPPLLKCPGPAKSRASFYCDKTAAKQPGANGMSPLPQQQKHRLRNVLGHFLVPNHAHRCRINPIGISRNQFRKRLSRAMPDKLVKQIRICLVRYHGHSKIHVLPLKSGKKFVAISKSRKP